jgi:hypothetical protein
MDLDKKQMLRLNKGETMAWKDSLTEVDTDLNGIGLEKPSGVASDENYVYLADSYNSCIIRVNKTDLKQDVTKKDIVGPCLTSGGVSALDSPHGVAVDDKYVYVADTHNDRIWRLNKGETLQLKETYQGSGDQALSGPIGVAVDDKYVYVADTNNNRIVRLNKGEPMKGKIMTWKDTYEGSGEHVIIEPSSVASDENYVYVVDPKSHRIVRLNKADLTWKDSFGAITKHGSYIEEIRKKVKVWLNSYGLSPKYITIISSFGQILADVNIEGIDRTGKPYFEQLDSKAYGNPEGKISSDIAVGRLLGPTTSDVSANIATVLFYNSFAPSTRALSIMYDVLPPIGDDHQSCIDFTRKNFLGEDITAKFSDGTGNTQVLEYGGMDQVKKDRNNIQNIWEDSKLIIFNDHGQVDGFQGPLSELSLSEMKPSVIFARACLTCSFSNYYAQADSRYSTSKKYQKVLCGSMIREGALAYVGAVDVLYGGGSDQPNNGIEIGIFTKGFILEGKSIGEAMKDVLNYDCNDSGESGWYYDFKNKFLLIGDPTITCKDLGICK